MDTKEILGLCLLVWIFCFIFGLLFGGYCMKKDIEHLIEYPQPTKDSCIELFNNLKY